MNRNLKAVLGISAVLFSAQAMAAKITFYEGEGFRGRVFVTSKQIADFQKAGFNDLASSVIVEKGRWQVCDDARFAGRCVVLQEGSYDTLRGIGLENRVSSVRPVKANARYENEVAAPLAAPNYEYRRRPDERVYEAKVTSVRAVVGPPEQRCWVEREQVGNAGQGDRNVGGAIVGAIIGGVLGHQVGGGHGQDLATAGGAVAGAVIGSNVGRNGAAATTQDVRRCETVANSGPPDYWDVVYEFKGVQHRVQMSAPPGPTIAVNQQGLPRQ